MHSKSCLANAIICAVENARDASEDFAFRILMQEGAALAWADGYLSDGTATCRCSEEWRRDYNLTGAQA